MNEMIFEMNHTLNCGYEIKQSYDPRYYGRSLSNCGELHEKFRALTGVWTRDLAIPVRHSNQLSYEATDVGLTFFCVYVN